MSYPSVQMHIDGKWRPAATGRTLTVINPATEEPIGTVPHADRSGPRRGAGAAEKGFRTWRNVSAYDRSKVMRKAAELIRERADKIATIMTHGAGQGPGRSQDRDDGARPTSSNGSPKKAAGPTGG